MMMFNGVLGYQRFGGPCCLEMNLKFRFPISTFQFERTILVGTVAFLVYTELQCIIQTPFYKASVCYWAIGTKTGQKL